jgi:GNAT superfamily N-acetyltransferase
MPNALSLLTREKKPELFFVGQNDDFTIGLMRRSDAAGAANLLLTIYRDGRPAKKYAGADSLVSANEKGEIISIVARDTRGEVIGHSALFNNAANSGTYEIGMAAVQPEYRGKGVFTRMISRCQEIAARNSNIAGIYGKPACNDISSQQAASGLGYSTFAFEMDIIPDSGYSGEKTPSVRIASLLNFKTIKRKPHVIYLPAIYEHTMRLIYRGLDDDRIIRVSGESLDFTGKTALETRDSDFPGVTGINVVNAGTDFESSSCEKEKTIRDDGTMIVQVLLRLSCPWAGSVVDILRRQGYFFGGILPRWFNEDGMLMQKSFITPDWERVVLDSPKARAILETARADWQKVS